MSFKYYIHLDSTYRNRKLYPLPSSYVVPVSSNNLNSLLSAVTAADPISIAYPQYTFTGQSANTVVTAFNGGTFIAPVLAITASNEDNFYNGYNITDATLAQTRQITGYVGATHTVTLSSPFSNTWAATDTYTINDPSTAGVIQFQPPASLVNNFYINKFLKNEATGEYRTIVSYNGNTRTATLDSPYSVWAIATTYTVRGTDTMEVGLVVAATQFTVTLPLTSSTVDNFYTGQFLYFLNGPAAGTVATITAYVGSTRTATVTPGLNPLPVPGNTYEVLPFTKDNCSPLWYNGSVFSQQETINYEISLVNISIPNKLLVVGIGSLPSFYPYLLVELTNETASAGHSRGAIYSNNPNDVRSTFVVPMTDVNNPETAQFLELACPMDQTTRFKPNDSLRFTLKLPNGELFNVGPDTQSPLAPDPTKQISAIFSIRRTV